MSSDLILKHSMFTKPTIIINMVEERIEKMNKCVSSIDTLLATINDTSYFISAERNAADLYEIKKHCFNNDILYQIEERQVYNFLKYEATVEHCKNDMTRLPLVSLEIGANQLHILRIKHDLEPNEDATYGFFKGSPKDPLKKIESNYGESHREHLRGIHRHKTLLEKTILIFEQYNEKLLTDDTVLWFDKYEVASKEYEYIEKYCYDESIRMLISGEKVADNNSSTKFELKKMQFKDLSDAVNFKMLLTEG